MSKIAYNKPHLTFDEQLARLKDRGLAITDRRAAIDCLRRIGYYRLSAYWYPFRAVATNDSGIIETLDHYRPGYSLDHAVSLYEFDRSLRLVLMDAIERIEISVRVELAYHLGSQDPIAQHNPTLMHPNFTKPKNKKPNSRSSHDDWKLDEQHHYWRSSEKFADHFASTYELPLPIWISAELWDFGMLSKLYAGISVKNQTHIADYYGVSDWQVMGSWLRALNHVRNIAAHHGRLWNRNLDDQPKMPKLGTMPKFDHVIRHRDPAISRVYATLCISLYLIDRIDPASDWRQRLVSLIHGFPSVQGIDLSHMGFPSSWDRQELWAI